MSSPKDSGPKKLGRQSVQDQSPQGQESRVRIPRFKPQGLTTQRRKDRRAPGPKDPRTRGAKDSGIQGRRGPPSRDPLLWSLSVHFRLPVPSAPSLAQRRLVGGRVFRDFKVFAFGKNVQVVKSSTLLSLSKLLELLNNIPRAPRRYVSRPLWCAPPTRPSASAALVVCLFVRGPDTGVCFSWSYPACLCCIVAYVVFPPRTRASEGQPPQ